PPVRGGRARGVSDRPDERGFRQGIVQRSNALIDHPCSPLWTGPLSVSMRGRGFVRAAATNACDPWSSTVQPNPYGPPGGPPGRLRRPRATRACPPCSLTRTAHPADRPAGGVRAVERLAPRGLTSYPGKFQLV